MIPDDIDTRVAIKSASRAIDLTRGNRTGRRAAERGEEGMIGFVVRRGFDLADARTYALSAALIRDALLTRAELGAKIGARA